MSEQEYKRKMLELKKKDAKIIHFFDVVGDPVKNLGKAGAYSVFKGNSASNKSKMGPQEENKFGMTQEEVDNIQNFLYKNKKYERK